MGRASGTGVLRTPSKTSNGTSNRSSGCDWPDDEAPGPGSRRPGRPRDGDPEAEDTRHRKDGRGDARSAVHRRALVEEWRRLRDVWARRDEVHSSRPPCAVLDAEEAVIDLDRDLVTTPDSGGRFASSACLAAAAWRRRREGRRSSVRGPAPPVGSAQTPVRRPTAGDEDEAPGPARTLGPGDAGSGGTFTSAWPEADDEEEPAVELTLEDLKKAPPEYRDLPGPRREQPVHPGPGPGSSRSHPARSRAWVTSSGGQHVVSGRATRPGRGWAAWAARTEPGRGGSHGGSTGARVPAGRTGHRSSAAVRPRRGGG